MQGAAYEKADSARSSSRKMIILRKGKAIVEPDFFTQYVKSIRQIWKAFADYSMLHPKSDFKKHGNGIHPPICFLFKCVS
jgi:hypothetical protein